MSLVAKPSTHRDWPHTISTEVAETAPDVDEPCAKFVNPIPHLVAPSHGLVVGNGSLIDHAIDQTSHVWPNPAQNCEIPTRTSESQMHEAPCASEAGQAPAPNASHASFIIATFAQCTMAQCIAVRVNMMHVAQSL